MQLPLPAPEELARAYDGSYPAYQAAWRTAGWSLWTFLRAWTMRRRMALLSRHVSGSELLEVGSGGGDFLFAASRRGWHVCAVEYNATMADIARTELRLDVRSGELRPGLWRPGSFDVVVLWNVLEHVLNPHETLAVAYDYLRPGGKVLMSIPTRAAAEAGRLYGHHWLLLDLPRHLHFFDRQSLDRVCRSAKLELASFTTPALETCWCHLMSALAFARGRPSIHGRLGAVSLTLALAGPIVVYATIRAIRGSGTEAMAVAVKHV
ncbi:MAG TPA: class I SAM-dependent methyltransferase [Burkholderiales bacterium]|nr:class I SAM-dependent methyltransferase [Burkholderiales bacterium]